MLCELLTSKLPCNDIVLFARDIKSDIELKIEDGKGEFTNYKGTIGDTIRICGDDNFTCDEVDLIDTSLIYTNHILESENSFNFKYEYITKDLTVNILNKINIITLSSEQLAFELFKSNPANYIFVIPTIKKIQNYDNEYIRFYKHYVILLLLYNRVDINSTQHITKIEEIENDILNIIVNSEYDFNSSEYVFNTQYTLLKRINIVEESSYERSNNECYNLILNNPVCEDL